MKTHGQKGFSAIEGILIIIIVLMVGGIGWYVQSGSNKTSSNLANADKSSGSTTTTPQKASTQATTSQVEKAVTDDAIIMGVAKTYCLAKDSPCTPSITAKKGVYAEVLAGKYNLLVQQSSDKSWVYVIGNEVSSGEKLCNLGSNNSSLYAYCH